MTFKPGFEARIKSSIVGEREKAFQAERITYAKQVGLFLIFFPLPLALLITPFFFFSFFSSGQYKSPSVSNASSFREGFGVSEHLPFDSAWTEPWFFGREMPLDSTADPDLVSYFEHLEAKAVGHPFSS